jgi:tetratricopeptide (TPR) repeat protein
MFAMRSLSLAAVWLVAASLAPSSFSEASLSTAHAQATPAATPEPDTTTRDREARAIYEAAVVAFDEGRFEDSLRLFRRAYELSERPELLFNVGTAADRLRHNEEALEAFEAYLAARPDAENRANVEARIAVLRRAIADAARPTPEPSVVVVREHEPGTEPPPKSRWWIGLIAGVVVAAGAAAVIAIVTTRNGDDDFQEPAHDAAFTTLTRW